MTTLPIKLVADQGAPGAAWPTTDAAALAELQATVAHLADVVSALSATLTVAGTVAVSNQNAQPLTNTQLRQAPVPISGTFGDENGVPFSELNPLPVDFGGSIAIENLSVQYDSHISTVNSTDTPLAADEVFLGTWEDVKDFASISASILTDAGSTFNGAVAEFSADGINVMTRQAATIPAGTGGFFSFAPQGRYFRINYTNGPAPQTTLEVEVKFSFNPPAITQAPLGALTTDASITTGTTAALQGRIMAGPSAGVWQPIGTDGAGNLQVAATGSVEVTNHPVPQTDGLTDTELRATPLPVDVDFPITQTVNGTVTVANPTAQGLTDAELRATPLPISGSVTVSDGAGPLSVDGTVSVGNFPATQPVSGTVTVANPTAQGLTDAQLRAAAVPVSGPQTDAQARATPQPVSGTVTVSNPTAQGLTDAQLRAADVNVANFAGRELALPPVVATVTAAGNTTIHTPAAGKRIRLLWTHAISDPSQPPPLVKVFLGAQEQYRVWAVSHTQVLKGPVDGALIINLSAAATVAVTAFIEEV